MIVTLEQLKEHLNIEDSTDDNYLRSLIVVSEDAVYKNLNKDGGEVSPTTIQAILILAGTLYENREGVSYANATTVPHTFDYLIGLDKNYSDDYYEGRTTNE